MRIFAIGDLHLSFGYGVEKPMDIFGDLWQDHTFRLEKLWKEGFWSQSFCLLTAGDTPAEVIRQYIETQGEKKH